MKKRNILSMLLVLTLLCGLLSGCGASSAPNTHRKMEMELAADEAAPAEAPAAAGAAMDNGALAEESGSTATALPEARKWIVTMHISAETDDLDAMTAQLTRQIESQKGYVEDQRVYNGSSYENRRYRSASLTIRIPADQADSFTENVACFSNVVSKEKNLEDITLRYVATESRLTALETEEARLLELLAKAETMADLLEIETRLTDVRCELEAMASQKRLYDNQIDYATIYLTISEVQEYTPVEEPGVWQRISDGFVRSLKSLGEGAVDLLVWIIAYSPYLVVLGAVAAAVILVIKCRRKAKKSKDTPPQAQ